MTEMTGEDSSVKYIHVTHEFPPLYDADSKILILGSIPSPKSREQSFYYGHPQNRFWKVMAAVFGEKEPSNIEDKKKMMLTHKIALWDVLEECDIIGASDSSIRNPVPTDINWLLKRTQIKNIFTTGKTSYKYYRQFSYPKTGIEAKCLPSTSPANCRCTFDELIRAYSKISEGI